jgi:hypothetical protein
MKNLVPLLAISILTTLVFTACQSKSLVDPSNGQVLTYTDTLGLAQFQKWKTLNELKDPSAYYQQGSEAISGASSQKPARSYVPANKSESLNSEGQYPSKTSVKKGWSRKAKGAVIGGGGGAIIGALINKNNRLVGGALGGAVGAGVGYIVGNELDRKHGR